MTLFSHSDGNPQPPDKLGRKLLACAARPAGEFVLDKALALLHGGADVHVVDNDGNSALTLAAREGHTGLVTALLQAGADANHYNNEWFTPLMWAAYYGRTDVAAALLAGGAKLDASSRAGTTASGWAIEQGHPEIAKMIEDANASRVHAAIAKAAATPAPKPPAPENKEPPAPVIKTKWPKGFEL
jgi:ankyrin repeat protein